MVSTGARRKGREAALQLLYQIEITADASDDAVAEFWTSRGVSDPAERTFGDDLVRRVLEGRAAIDALIDGAADNWNVERIAKMDLNLLRLGVAEMVGDAPLPPEIVMNEAVEIAKKYCDAGSASFINGVLDRVARELGNTTTRSGEES